MAPQTEIPVVSVPGHCAAYFAVCADGDLQYERAGRKRARDHRYQLWCIQLVPHIWTNWRTKKTDGLPGSMMFLWALCGVPLGAYAVVQNFNLPLQIQPQCFMTLCLVSWVQTLIYHNNWPVWKASVLGAATTACFVGVETALILTLRPIYERGNEGPVLVVGIVAAVVLAAGLLPPYAEIWKRIGRVIGINWVFLTMDWFGAFFSLMALVAQRTFDILGGVLYIICCLLELGIFASHLMFLIRSRDMRKHASEQGKTFDEVIAEHQDQGLPFKFAERGPRKASDKKAGQLRDVGSDDVEWSAVARTETQGRVPPLSAGRDDQLAATGS
ncbi:hypothetical protein QBC34DRAFT_454287 [Podospora aff. communis PSN243]|uniref:PQ loop repeat protein n=1 Tax=Podospora aff. communis PSN243 TaxID=3040156 RepID=A0AAV9GZV3_9PEZI|nr:hypothetical protein QBC34DRAFT_454287 [Podospora aff. communis PSN243]